MSAPLCCIPYLLYLLCAGVEHIPSFADQRNKHRRREEEETDAQGEDEAVVEERKKGCV